VSNAVVWASFLSFPSPQGHKGFWLIPLQDFGLLLLLRGGGEAASGSGGSTLGGSHAVAVVVVGVRDDSGEGKVWVPDRIPHSPSGFPPSRELVDETRMLAAVALHSVLIPIHVRGLLDCCVRARAGGTHACVVALASVREGARSLGCVRACTCASARRGVRRRVRPCA